MEAYRACSKTRSALTLQKKKGSLKIDRKAQRRKNPTVREGSSLVVRALAKGDFLREGKM